MTRSLARIPLSFVLLGVFACGDSPTDTRIIPVDDPDDPEEPACTINLFEIQSGGVPRDGIPALSDPLLINASHPDAGYLLPDDRVIGIEVNGTAFAVPHNILWWHEIANFSQSGLSFAVSYCPLTGTAVAFDRAAVGGAEFGVSGLLFRNNLIMYDRNTDDTLWPQIMGEGVCGLRKREVLPRIPVLEMTWEAWQELHPQTQVVSDATGFSRDYTVYPYGEYEQPNEPPFLPQTFDRSRPPKERTLGLEGAEGSAMAVPFGELDTDPRTVHALTLDGELLTILWDRDAFTAIAFNSRPVDEAGTPQEAVTLGVVDGDFVDAETGSTWRLDGLAVSGPLAGLRLPLHPKAMIVFWFAWGGFHPTTSVFLPTTGEDGSGSGGGL